MNPRFLVPYNDPDAANSQCYEPDDYLALDEPRKARMSIMTKSWLTILNLIVLYLHYGERQVLSILMLSSAVIVY